jgi:hypothetical protein
MTKKGGQSKTSGVRYKNPNFFGSQLISLTIKTTAKFKYILGGSN